MNVPLAAEHVAKKSLPQTGHPEWVMAWSLAARALRGLRVSVMVGLKARNRVLGDVGAGTEQARTPLKPTVAAGGADPLLPLTAEGLVWAIQGHARRRDSNCRVEGILAGPLLPWAPRLHQVWRDAPHWCMLLCKSSTVLL